MRDQVDLGVVATLLTTLTPSTNSTAMRDQVTPGVMATLPVAPPTPSAAEENQLNTSAIAASPGATQANTTIAQSRVSSFAPPTTVALGHAKFNTGPDHLRFRDREHTLSIHCLPNHASEHHSWCYGSTASTLPCRRGVRE